MCTSGELRQYYDTMQRLFLDGYIMCPVSDSRTGGVPGLGDLPSKTLTQIAMEQFQDFVEISYGDKRKVLWSRTSKDDCAESLAQIQSITRDQLARLRAGFLDSEVYMCMRVFNVSLWQLDGDADVARARRLVQLRKARALSDAHHVPHSEDDWRRLGEAACQKQAELRLRPLVRRRGTHVDNRRVWSALLPVPGSSAAESVMRPAEESVVRSYVSLVDSTGDVERGLGVHADFVKHHVGAHEGGCCLSEI